MDLKVQVLHLERYWQVQYGTLDTVQSKQILKYGSNLQLNLMGLSTVGPPILGSGFLTGPINGAVSSTDKRSQDVAFTMNEVRT